MFSIPHISQVYIIFRACLLTSDFKPGQESLEVQLFRPEDIPWEALAFRVMHETLRHYIEDRQNNGFRLHTGMILPVLP